MEHTAKRSHEVTLIGDIQDREQIHICHRGGNSRGKVRTDSNRPQWPQCNQPSTSVVEHNLGSSVKAKWGDIGGGRVEINIESRGYSCWDHSLGSFHELGSNPNSATYQLAQFPSEIQLLVMKWGPWWPTYKGCYKNEIRPCLQIT